MSWIVVVLLYAWGAGWTFKGLEDVWMPLRILTVAVWPIALPPLFAFDAEDT